MDAGSPFEEAISAVDGLHASLIYHTEISPASESPALQILPLIRDMRVELGNYWESLARIASTQSIPGFNSVHGSFGNFTQFYELAILTFRNVLIGARPDTLNAVFSLCSLSYIASCCLRINGKSHNDDVLGDVDVWRAAIRDDKECQMFSDLADALWPQVSSISSANAPRPYDMTPTLGLPGNSSHQNEPIQALPAEVNSLLNNLPDSFWTFDATPNSSLSVGLDLQRTSSSLQDLQGSAIVSNLIHFLKECGEPLRIFSGGGVTTKDLYSYIAFNQRGSETKNTVATCVQRLKADETLQHASTRGILSVAERFVELGYLQSIDELRGYLLTVGRTTGIIPDGQLYVNFCLSVCIVRGIARRSTSPGRRARRTPPRSTSTRGFRCDVCGQLFSRSYNKNRHVETKHPWIHPSPDANLLMQGSVRLTV
ncbi:hypothetical protein BFJ63_vAg15996 [Fusarium oxysporum f. sp. narcissi]|uniref:C2H2-type domain-containing protein n=2 Tax=Fusarium oxysporum TaxID=5507 RepID=A0A4Q2V2E6_FUSOX|nr:hypothetical protein BFJ65_g17881 [Fusarium oxysporum f. sp. cepae]RKK40197.1 hypothetical protein BFJ66_g11634 [Fusarium oxysporum f. sp. cepae]RYC81111.1 hypothetical protein BFJ63_vAg15996 [Fusarium oxysporum f. sp. narcissi]